MSTSVEPTTLLSTRVPQRMKADLDRLAKTTGRTRNTLVEEAIQRFIDQQRWQIAEIEAGIQEANAGHFASDEEMDELWAEFGLEAETAHKQPAE